MLLLRPRPEDTDRRRSSDDGSCAPSAAGDLGRVKSMTSPPASSVMSTALSCGCCGCCGRSYGRPCSSLLYPESLSGGVAGRALDGGFGEYTMRARLLWVEDRADRRDECVVDVESWRNRIGEADRLAWPQGTLASDGRKFEEGACRSWVDCWGVTGDWLPWSPDDVESRAVAVTELERAGARGVVGVGGSVGTGETARGRGRAETGGRDSIWLPAWLGRRDPVLGINVGDIGESSAPASSGGVG